MNVNYVGMTPIPKSSYHLHTHKYWEIVLTTSGSISTLIDGDVYTVNTGDILVIPPNVPHSGDAGEGLFTDIYLQARSLPFNGPVITHDYDDSLSHLMPLAMKAKLSPEGDELADSIADLICRYIKKYRSTACLHPFVADFKNLIFDNIANADFDIAEEVKRLGFTTDYFRHCFVREVGMTPLRYLITLRIHESKKLLLCSTLSVTEIARQCGFADIYYFSRRFRSEVGMTAKEYRSKYQNL